MWQRSPWEGGQRLALKTMRPHRRDRDHQKTGRGTEAEGYGAAPWWSTYAESAACFPNSPTPPPHPWGWPGTAGGAVASRSANESVRQSQEGRPGPHPWLQHVVVAQSSRLAGEFALVPGAHAHVARDPVHGPREALEEVSAVVVGSTLLFTEGQCCGDKAASQSRRWSHCPPALRPAPRPPDAGACPPHRLPGRGPGGHQLHGRDSQHSRAPCARDTPSARLHPPEGPVPQPSPEPPGQSWVLQERKRVRRPSQYLPPLRGAGRVQSREENWTPPPQVREQSPQGPQWPQPPARGICRSTGRRGRMETLPPGPRARPAPDPPPHPAPELTLKSRSWSTWRQRPPMQAWEGPQGVPSAQGECLVWHMA